MSLDFKALIPFDTYANAGNVRISQRFAFGNTCKSHADELVDAAQKLTAWVSNEVLNGRICPYCCQDSIYVDSAELYGGKSFGMVYLCEPCQAWVGVHRETDNALGRLADSMLRRWKRKAHEAFDPLWKGGGFKRNEAYGWLAKKLAIPIEYCHIGYFDVFLCKRVTEVTGYAAQILQAESKK